MTKLYCPKGHEIAEPTLESLKEITVKFKDSHNRRCTQWLLYCDICYRPYLGCDLLADDTNVVEQDSNSLEPHVNDMNVVETKLTPSDMQLVKPKREYQIAIDRVVEALDHVIQIIIEESEKIGQSIESSAYLWGSFELLKRELKELNK